MIPLDDRPAPAANRDRKLRTTFDPATWPGWLVGVFFAVLIVLAGLFS